MQNSRSASIIAKITCFILKHKKYEATCPFTGICYNMCMRCSKVIGYNIDFKI